MHCTDTVHRPYHDRTRAYGIYSTSTCIYYVRPVCSVELELYVGSIFPHAQSLVRVRYLV